jgi:hypothetical protein
MTYAAPDELDEPDDEPMFGQFAELCGVVLGVVVLGVVVLGDVVVPPPEAAQAAPPLAERATAATAATWRIRAIGYLLCRILRSNQRHLRAVAENAVSVLRSPYARQSSNTRRAAVTCLLVARLVGIDSHAAPRPCPVTLPVRLGSAATSALRSVNDCRRLPPIKTNPKTPWLAPLSSPGTSAVTR